MKTKTTGLLLAVATSLVLGAPAQAKTYKLTIAAGQPPRALPNLAKVRDYFVPEILKRIKAAGLKDTIVFKQAYTGSLLKPRRVLLGVQDGIADIGYVPTVFHPDKLPLEQVSFATPFCTTDLSKITHAVNVLHKNLPAMKAQYDKFKVIRLAGSGVDNYELFTTFPVKTVDDVKGKKIGTAGALLQWLKGLGVTTVDSNMMRYYNQTKTGVYQGFIVMGSAMPPMKYPEVARYVTSTDFGAQYAIALAMNKNSLKRLPAALRKIVLDVGRNWGPVGDKAYAGANKWGHRTARKMFKKAIFTSLSQAERVKWANKLPNIAKEWAARLEKRGLPGNKVLSMYMNALRAQGVKCARQWDKS